MLTNLVGVVVIVVVFRTIGIRFLPSLPLNGSIPNLHRLKPPHKDHDPHELLASGSKLLRRLDA